MYYEDHNEVDLGGHRKDLGELADHLTDGSLGSLPLDAPPSRLMGKGSHALETIHREPSEDASDRIMFRREGAALVIAGGSEVGRVIGGSIRFLADSPQRTAENLVSDHVHLDPTTDPEHEYFSPESGSIVVYLTDEDE